MRGCEIIRLALAAQVVCDFLECGPDDLMLGDTSLFVSPRDGDFSVGWHRCLEPGGCTAFRSHSNSNTLTHPARGR